MKLGSTKRKYFSWTLLSDCNYLYTSCDTFLRIFFTKNLDTWTPWTGYQKHCCCLRVFFEGNDSIAEDSKLFYQWRLRHYLHCVNITSNCVLPASSLEANQKVHNCMYINSFRMIQLMPYKFQLKSILNIYCASQQNCPQGSPPPYVI